MLKPGTLSTFARCATCVGLFMLLASTAAYAQANNSGSGAPGDVEIRLLESIFTGNIGLTLGLAIAIMGIFSFVKNDIKGAIIMVTLGVLITLTPGIYNGVRLITCTLVTSLGDNVHCGTGNTAGQ